MTSPTMSTPCMNVTRCPQVWPQDKTETFMKDNNGFRNIEGGDPLVLRSGVEHRPLNHDVVVYLQKVG